MPSRQPATPTSYVNYTMTHSSDDERDEKKDDVSTKNIDDHPKRRTTEIPEKKTKKNKRKSVVVKALVERVKLFNTTLVAIEAKVLADQPRLILTSQEPCTIGVTDKDEIQYLRNLFGWCPPNTQTSGWISCVPNKEKKKTKKMMNREMKQKMKGRMNIPPRHGNQTEKDVRELEDIDNRILEIKRDEEEEGITSTATTSTSSTVLSCRILVTTEIERNRRGRKMLECTELLEIHRDVDQEEFLEWASSAPSTATPPSSTGRRIERHEDSMKSRITVEKTDDDDEEEEEEEEDERVWHDKRIRHQLFATWLVETFGKERLASGTGVLDVAGGKGELGEALRDEYNIPSILLDPLPRCDRDSPPFPIIEHPLEEDGSRLMEESTRIAHLIENCSIITGMHPDQATEAIVDMALRLGKAFAILPCCVMPKLFPNRMQKRHNQPVRSHSTFCEYLLDKAPPGYIFQVHHLPFNGRNKIIYFDILCLPVITTTSDVISTGPARTPALR